MNTCEFTRKREKKAGDDMRAQFKKHVTYYEMLKRDEKPFTDFDHLIWKDPDSCLYQVNYILDHGRIHVSGDLGSGTFQNGYGTVFDLVHHDFHYLASKMVDVDGRNQMLGKTYCADLCTAQMKLWMKDKENSPELKKTVDGWEGNEYQQDEWRQFIYRSGNAEDLHELHDFGIMLHPRVIGWLVGIEMACNQLHPHTRNVPSTTSGETPDEPAAQPAG